MITVDAFKSGPEQYTDDAAKSSSDCDVEKYEESSGMESVEALKLDNNGLPLVPQPSRFKDDPLVSTFSPAVFFSNQYPELAGMVEMGCPHTSRLHGLPRTLQFRSDQPLARSTR